MIQPQNIYVATKNNGCSFFDGGLRACMHLHTALVSLVQANAGLANVELVSMQASRSYAHIP